MVLYGFQCTEIKDKMIVGTPNICAANQLIKQAYVEIYEMGCDVLCLLYSFQL